MLLDLDWRLAPPFSSARRFASAVELIKINRRFRLAIFIVIILSFLVSVGVRAYHHYRPTLNPSSVLIEDEDFKLLKITPEQKAEFDRLKAPLFQYKAALLDSPQHHQAEVARDRFRAMLEDTEKKHGRLIDMVKVQCLPKPPAIIAKNEVDIDISARMVADELPKTSFWIIRENKSVKVRVPIVLFVSLTNQTTPRNIDLFYLDARSVNGWADIRMADSLFPGVKTMSERPLVLEAKNANASMEGEYLLPSLYDRIIQPGDKVEGWIIAEYPNGFKYGNSIGDLRISLLSGGHWIASKTFPADPRIYDNERHRFDWYLTPLDTLITEDW